MRAMVFEEPGRDLVLREVPVPEPGEGQVLVKVAACAVCRTDLHVIDGDLPDPKLPLIPGHEIAGRVAALGRGVENLAVGTGVGIPWLGWTCGACEFCQTDRENLCDRALFTGYTLDGGYAEYTVADARFCFRLPSKKAMSDCSCAPLLCAGLIGYRSLRFSGFGKRLGIYGFGAAAHIVTQVARFQGREVYAFTRPGDKAARKFARGLGACWAGDSNQEPPVSLDAAIIFAPAGELVPAALRAVHKGGIVVCGGIHMSDIPSFPYSDLWGERTICSVANLTRKDGRQFLALAPKVPVHTETKPYALEQANLALEDLRLGRLNGAAVLMM